ncbi:hypothetical protein ACHAWF_012018 [Thalassiosira exigua]
MVLKCFSLSQVDDKQRLSKVVRSTRAGHRRQGSTSSLNQRSRKPRTKDAFRTVKARDEGENDPLSLVGSELLVRDYPLAVMERRSPTSGGREGDEERLRRLETIVRRDGTEAGSGRKRGPDEIGSMASTATSTLSSEAPQNIRNKAIRRIHGKGRPAPTCPQCSGKLTYLYLSRTNERSRPALCEIRSGNASYKEKLRNLLPPLCESCRTHLLFEHSECIFLLMDKFNEWLESGLVEECSEDESESDHRGTYDFGDPRNARLIVVNPTPPAADVASEQGSRGTVPFPNIYVEETPRLNNTTRGNRGTEESSRFTFDYGDAQVMSEKAGFSDLSSMSDGVRKKSLSPPHYEHLKVICDNLQSLKEQRLQGNDCYISEDSEEDERTGRDHEIDEHPNRTWHKQLRISTGTAEDSNDELKLVAVVVRDPSDSLKDQSSVAKSLGSIKLARTDSEELAILQCHSMKKEIATMQIAKGLIRGNELSPTSCDRCKMPFMQKGDRTEDCVTCPAIARKAKRKAEQKRKKLEKQLKKHNQLRKAKGGVLDFSGEKRHDTLSKREDAPRGGQCKSDSASLEIIQDGSNLNTLEEGLLRTNDSAGSGQDSCHESVGHPASYCHQHSASSADSNSGKAVSNNPPASHQSDYWVRHSSSQHSANWPTPKPKPTILLSSNSYQSGMQTHHSSIEHSLSLYQTNTARHRQSNLGLNAGQVCYGHSNQWSVSGVSSGHTGEQSSLHSCDAWVRQSQLVEAANADQQSQHPESSSEVSSCKTGALPAAVETSFHQVRSQESIMSEVSRETESQHSQTLSTEAMSQHHSNLASEQDWHAPNRHHIQHQGSSSEVSDNRSHSQLTEPDGQLPSNDATHCNFPTSNHQHQPDGVEQISLTQSNECRSVSKDTGHQSLTQVSGPGQPGSLPPNNYVSHCQHKSCSKEVEQEANDMIGQHPSYDLSCASSTRCPRDLPPCEMIHQWPHSISAAKERDQLPHAHCIQNQQSQSKMSSQVPKSQQSSQCGSAEMSQHDQKHIAKTDASHQLFQCGINDGYLASSFSEESSTRCPRRLPSSEMIWHHGSHNCTSASQPMQVVAAQHSGVISSVSPDDNKLFIQLQIVNSCDGSRCHVPDDSGQKQSDENSRNAAQNGCGGRAKSQARRTKPLQEVENDETCDRGASDAEDNESQNLARDTSDERLNADEVTSSERENDTYDHSALDAASSHTRHTNEKISSDEQVPKVTIDKRRVSEDIPPTQSPHRISSLAPGKSPRFDSLKDDGSPDAEEILGRAMAHKDTLNECQIQGEAPACQSPDKTPCLATRKGLTFMPKDDGSQDSEESLFRAKIAQLAASLQEVADQLPLKGNCQRTDDETRRSTPLQHEMDGQEQTSTLVPIESTALLISKCDEIMATNEYRKGNNEKKHLCDDLSNFDLSNNLVHGKAGSQKTPPRPPTSIPFLNSACSGGEIEILRSRPPENNNQTADVFGSGKYFHPLPSPLVGDRNCYSSHTASPSREFQRKIRKGKGNQTTDVFRSGNHFHPIPSPIVGGHNFVYRHMSPLKRPQHKVGTPSEASADVDLASSCFWGGGCKPISVSPINIQRDDEKLDIFFVDETNKTPSPNEKTISSPQQKRSDPPGRSLKACEGESRDPPDDRSDPSNRYITPKSETKLKSINHCTNLLGNAETAFFAQMEVTPRKQAKRHVDGPRTNELDRPNSATPKRTVRSKGQESLSKGHTQVLLVNDKVRTPRGQTNAHNAIGYQKQLIDDDQLEVLPWGADAADTPLKTANSFGDSSLGQLFKQIDEIEDDFVTIAASMPSSEGSPNDSEKHSLVGITVNNARSFESHDSGESMVTDAVQRMRRIKDYIEQTDSVDENDGSVGSYDSEGEMSELISRLTSAAETLRKLHDCEQ